MIDKLKIQQMIGEAIARATNSDIVFQYETQEKKLLRDYLDNRLTIDEFFDKLHELEKELVGISFYTARDFQYTMEYLRFTKQQMQDCLNEDMKQYAYALENNLPIRFTMFFYHTLEGKNAVYVTTQEHLSRTMRDELRRI